MSSGCPIVSFHPQECHVEGAVLGNATTEDALAFGQALGMQAPPGKTEIWKANILRSSPPVLIAIT
eukprot:3469719-Amphidinium_carterae.1